MRRAAPSAAAAAAAASLGLGLGLGAATGSSWLWPAPPAALCDGQRARLDGPRVALGVVPGGDKESPALYKSQFATAYDAAARQSEARREANQPTNQQSSGAGETEQAEQRVRRGIATHLMSKLGYSREELAALGDDVLRMQGVNSPFPLAQLRRGESVLDLGSGFGADAFLAAHKVGDQGRVVGLDISAEEVRQARSRAVQRFGVSQERCSFVTGDMEMLPMEAASLDCVISNGGFCLCPDKRKAFGEIFRVLKPGGRLAIACTVLRTPSLPPLEGKRWPPCMEVFMPQAAALPLLAELGFTAIAVDDSNAAMDVWDIREGDVGSVSSAMVAAAEAGRGEGEGELCSHAKKASERRAAERVNTYLCQEREAGIHSGNPDYGFVEDVDMNSLCARVVIFAVKPPATGAAAQ